MQKIIKFYQSQDKIIFSSNLLSLLSSLIIILIWGLNYQNLPSKLPLFYSLPWGEQNLVSLNQFITLSLLIILIAFFNLFILWHLHPSQLVLKRMLSVTSAAVSLLLLITALKIIYIFI